MLPYAAYLRVYEPVSVFPHPERALWAAYADSPARPRRSEALAAEQEDTLRRLLARPPVAVPDTESRNAYVLRSGGGVYVCPWQTRLRIWRAFDRFRDTLPKDVARVALPPGAADRARLEYERWQCEGHGVRAHIQTSTWHVPLAWFVPFAPNERCLVLGGPAEGSGQATAAATRTLTYVTSMDEARRRLTDGLQVVRGGLGEGFAASQLLALGHWLAEFHADSLVELDYGGLVHLCDDDALRGDESVAEVAVALAAMERGEVELTVAMYKRLLARWRPVQALESAN
ncbi:hypothetical protein DPM19_18415 [Actinomadura craniellae]|uniref:DUF8083 domain-containing protein n=1 Tax=Actinomadura craniellae TaxID=2231787 RepID=A0A365H3Q1_9ACTN|nr:hypothetical protein [Actinomadura craniellae]RAY13646.1 hypothetical protein DPM19_18415 [Actinomadura craniellae]